MDNIFYSKTGAASLQIKEDKMSAWLTLHKKDKIIDENEILELISEAGIRYGFEDAIQWMIDNNFEKDYEKPFPIAMCKVASGQKKITFHFDTSRFLGPHEDWSINDLQNWSYVPAGYVLADVSINLFTEGGSIYNVLGELAEIDSTKLDLSNLQGQNVYLIEEHNQLVAGISGYPFIDEKGAVHIINKLEYKGDLKDILLPIQLGTSLIVHGSVINAAMSILGDLIIDGDLENSEIYTEGNLTIKGKIISCRGMGVVSKGDIKVKSIYDSFVICKGNLFFETSIDDSRVIADTSIKGDLDHSSVDRSQIQSAGSIDIASAGSPDGVSSEIEISISPYIKELLTIKTKQLVKLKDSTTLNAEKIEQLQNELKELENQLTNDLSEYLQQDNQPKRYIKIHRDVYAGVYIRILKQSYNIKKYQTESEWTS